MGKLTMQKLLRITAVLIFVIGAGLGYDLGDKQMVVNQAVVETFDVCLALLSWFVAFSLGLLFLARSPHHRPAGAIRRIFLCWYFAIPSAPPVRRP